MNLPSSFAFGFSLCQKLLLHKIQNDSLPYFSIKTNTMKINFFLLIAISFSALFLFQSCERQKELVEGQGFINVDGGSKFRLLII